MTKKDSEEGKTAGRPRIGLWIAPGIPRIGLWMALGIGLG